MTIQYLKITKFTGYTCHVVSARDSILHIQCSNCSIVDRAAATGLQPRNDCTSVVGKRIPIAPEAVGRFAK